MKTDNCSIYENCSNTEGSFNCSCKDGFSGDGINSTGNYEVFLFCFHPFLNTTVMKYSKQK